MDDGALLALLATEAERRTPMLIEAAGRIIAGEGTDEDAETIRAESHGLKGAASVIGQTTLAELAEMMERHVVVAGGPSAIDADAILTAARAFLVGAQAAAAAEPEPVAVAASITALRP